MMQTKIPSIKQLVETGWNWAQSICLQWA